jgi:diaminopimelate epimerase
VQLKFWKLEGTGNDFIALSSFHHRIPLAKRPAMARTLCCRRRSIGADGLFFLDPSKNHHFKMRYYNPDGSEAGICGNGARSAAFLAHHLGLAPRNITFEAPAGLYRAKIKVSSVVLSMSLIKAIQLNVSVRSRVFNGIVHFVDIGVPHIVIVTDDIKDLDVVTIGRALRHHQRFQPQGTNVNFITVRDKHSINIRTYERGVEDETLACGTGSVSSAVAATLKRLTRSPVAIHTRGGDTLTVRLKIKNHSVEQLQLEGKARIVFTGELHYPL